MNEKFAAALGTFDGIHTGHKKILDAVLSLPGLTPLAVTFDRPPKAPSQLLMTPQQKCAQLRRMGFDNQLVLNFDDVRDLSPDEFIDRLFSEYPIGALVCGFNFRFGKDARGDADTLLSLCARRGAKVIVCEGVFVDGKIVSSTRIRGLISNGLMDEANRLLGRPFSLTAPVARGDMRGRKLGFPTINQPRPDGVVLPLFGVYASRTEIDGKLFQSVTNIGLRPTFKNEKPTFETHIFDFDGDVYDREITVELLHFIRPERKFSGADELSDAIAADADRAKSFF